MNDSLEKLAVFWGCLILYRLPWIELAARKVLPRLKINMIDLPFSCCPDPIVSRSFDHYTWLTLAARNLCLAEEQGLDILTLCSGCFETLKVVQKELSNLDLRKKVNQILIKTGHHYQGTTDVFHFQQWLYEKIGPEQLSLLVSHPISVKVATHTGCHFTRPAEILQTDNPIFPEKLDVLCEVLGLESVDYPDKNLCCGINISFTERELSLHLIQRKIEGAHKAGCQALVAHCPSCIHMIDSGQVLLKRKNPGMIEPLPVLHYLELLGLALGLKREEFDFNEHEVDVTLDL